jgi:hypothetical protein
MEAAPPREETAPTPTAAESSAELPGSHGPLGRNHRAMRPVEEAFRSVAPLRKAERFTISELKAIARETRLSPVAISGCDLEVLKIFAASNWVPVVVIRSPVGPKHVWSVVGYDDSTEQLILIDPAKLAQASQASLDYSEFSKQWDDPQKTCLLIFSQRVGVDKIKSVLKKYLPEEKVDSIQIRTSRGS